MGEVYRARDTKLKRHVAIKILPSSLAADSDRLARLQREAEVLASLNHPNIAAIYGLEDADGVKALVMELVEGEDLSQRIARGPIPIDEALPIAKQIAEALEAAHEQGIIHRDLKPANIKVRPDGTVKVLDFGLAKALEPTRSATGTSHAPTITSPAMTTGFGVLLGTAAYMAPERAQGEPVNKRADIWAFGCVLYEMLTGRRAFTGDDVFHTLASVLHAEPDWSVLPATTPPAMRRLLRRSLAKDRNRRMADIADARMDIEDASAEPAVVSTVAGPIARKRSTPIVAVAAATVMVALTVLVLRVLSPQPISQDRSVIRLELNMPAGVEAYVAGQSLALSPDGSSVAILGVLNGVRQLFLRRLDQFEATTPLLRGMAFPLGCFFSPNGRSLACFDAPFRSLKRVSVVDGLVVPLASGVDWTAGGVWGQDDRLTFTREGALWQASSEGGVATQLTRLDKAKGEVSHRWPTITSDGKVLLFTVVTGHSRDAAHIESLTLATGQRQVLIDRGSVPLYAPSGHLIFYRDGALFAVAFDVTRTAVTGPTVRVLENLAVDTNGVPKVALSQTGALVYTSNVHATSSRMVWVSRQGLEQPLDDTPRQYAYPRVSPNGEHLVVTSSGDLWILDLARKALPRLTSNATAGNGYPVWTPDGTRVVFRTLTGLAWIAADGSGRSEAIAGTSNNDLPTSVSPDGETLAFLRLNGETSADIFRLSLRGEPNPRPVVKGPAFEGGAQFSPNGRWLAYVSDEPGQPEVYVRPFPGPGGPVIPVSTQGGTQPRWSRNGKELFYRTGNRMMVVDVIWIPDLVLSPPRTLFDQRYSSALGGTTPNYDVSPDGQRFLMVKDELVSGRLNVVLNWTEELKHLVPTN